MKSYLQPFSSLSFFNYKSNPPGSSSSSMDSPTSKSTNQVSNYIISSNTNNQNINSLQVGDILTKQFFLLISKNIKEFSVIQRPLYFDLLYTSIIEAHHSNKANDSIYYLEGGPRLMMMSDTFLFLVAPPYIPILFNFIHRNDKIKDYINFYMNIQMLQSKELSKSRSKSDEEEKKENSSFDSSTIYQSNVILNYPSISQYLDVIHENNVDFIQWKEIYDLIVTDVIQLSSIHHIFKSIEDPFILTIEYYPLEQTNDDHLSSLQVYCKENESLFEELSILVQKSKL